MKMILTTTEELLTWPSVQSLNYLNFKLLFLILNINISNLKVKLKKAYLIWKLKLQFRIIKPSTQGFTLHRHADLSTIPIKKHLGASH
jgi:hypothetical protein